MRILHVDDHEDFGDLLTLWLGELGHACTYAATVGRARELLATAGPFEVVLTDVTLPDGTGADVVEAVRASVSRRARCVAVTGRADVDASRYDHVLVKPVGLDDVASLLGT